LRDEYRMVLVLRFLSELSPEETAHTMGRSEGAIRVLQHRALVAVRNLLEVT
jgi:RNA polymerase sigma-70 factor, ECF subfamily